MVYDHILFKLNCEYYPKISFEDETNSHLRSCFINKLVDKLRANRNLLSKSTLYTKVKKKVHSKRIKSRSYTLGKKV